MEKEKKEVVELVEIATVNPYPEVDTKRVHVTKRIKGTDTKVGMRLPVPTNDDQATAWYGVDMEGLLTYGVRQTSYGYRRVDALLIEDRARAGDVDEVAFEGLVQEDMKKTPRVSGETVKVSKADKETLTVIKAITEKFGISAEMAAEIIGKEMAKKAKKA